MGAKLDQFALIPQSNQAMIPRSNEAMVVAGYSIKYQNMFNNRSLISSKVNLLYILSFDTTVMFYVPLAIGATTFTIDGNRLLVALPKGNRDRGSFFIYNTANNGIERVNCNLDSAGYFGFAMIAGSFDNRTRLIDAVFSSPRAKMYRGEIYRSNGQSPQSIISGSSFGRYFGYSILAIDMDGNGIDDLLVGIPFHSVSKDQRGDEGIVLGYRNIGNGRFEAEHLVSFVGNKSPNSRFGSAMAKVGDINRDGVVDFAIGAPYEEQCGAIYLYNGGKYSAGSTVEYAQVSELIWIE